VTQSATAEDRFIVIASPIGARLAARFGVPLPPAPDRAGTRDLASAAGPQRVSGRPAIRSGDEPIEGVCGTRSHMMLMPTFGARMIAIQTMYKSVSCGFYKKADGSYWGNQDFPIKGF
jgi:hypothetical protein